MPVILKPDSITTQMQDMERRLRILENTQRVTPDVTKAGWAVNIYKFRVWMQTTVQSLVSNSTTVVHFDAVDYDTVSGWNASGFYYVVPIGGVWDLSWHVNINTTGHGAFGQFQLATMCVVGRGGSNVYFKQVNVVAGTGTASSVPQTGYDATLTDKFSVLAGDQIQLQVNQFNDLGVALNLSNGGTLGQYVSLAGHLIST